MLACIICEVHALFSKLFLVNDSGPEMTNATGVEILYYALTALIE